MRTAVHSDAPRTERTVSRAEWEEAVKAHLAKEKKLMRLQDELSAERRRLRRAQLISA